MQSCNGYLSATRTASGTGQKAKGKIDGSHLVVSAKGVEKPVAVRYAYTSQPLGHLLYNTGGMPVGPFTTCGYDEIRQTEGK
jgi:sialate O-acetylesterase